MVAVLFEKVRKAFGSTVAVQDLDLEIATGEFVSLLGPSGCGKTTTLRMLAGLEQPSSGTIRIDDQVVNNLGPGQRDIAMVFQSYALYPHMTVAENIAYPLRKRGVARSERDRRVSEVAHLLQLKQLLSQRPRQLSGGQQQRVALGRALVRDPKVFLLDEPLSNLDAQLRAHMRSELIELHGRLGRTMVYVTHDQLEAMTMSHRIAVMRGGVLQQFAKPAEIYHRPRNAFVAGFIGTPSMTLLDGTIRDAATVQVGSALWPIPEAYIAPQQAGTKVAVGVRPDDVVLGSGPHTAKVRVVESLGHESIVQIEEGGVTIKVRTAGDTPLRAGDQVSFDLRSRNLHFFDRSNGTRLNIE